ncbi:acetolactate decarboxylase [Streptomyces sp. NPDC048269]|uniref:acetolactate decarboxylase n=1 Tax=Streptomyces sp. NPDC048269 TaxID=3155753 RepID=UPI003430C043
MPEPDTTAHDTSEQQGARTRPRGRIFQTSTMTAMLEGVYEGTTTVAELRRNGDFGIGTFDRLDGEMIVLLDGRCYRLRADGTAGEADTATRTPLAAVTYFHGEHDWRLTEPVDAAGLRTVIDNWIPSPNLFYAVRVDGHFDHMVTRMLPEQHRPYPRLIDAVAGQVISTHTELHGTIVGFRSPTHMLGVAAAGYHLHFLSSCRTRGGHAYDFVLRSGRVRVDVGYELLLRMPRTQDFRSAQLGRGDIAGEIEAVLQGGPKP